MEDKSSSTPLFRNSADDLALKLAEIPTAEAASLAREARELCTKFESWVKERPTNEARVATIQDLFDLNRRAMDFLSKHGRTSSGGSLATQKGPPSSSTGSKR